MLPLHLSVLFVFGSFFFRPMVPRQPSRSNLADPDIILGTVLCFVWFQALSLLPFDYWPDVFVVLRVLVVSHSPSNRWPTSYFFASWLFLFHRPIDGPTSAVHVQRRGLWCSVRQCSLISLFSSGKRTDRPLLRHYPSSRKLVWPSQRDTCSLILF